MDPPYCLVYPTSYVRDVVPDHFDTHNNLVGMRLHCCVCCATLQFANDNPKQLKNYSGSRLILPCRAQYNDQLFPTILELQNHWEPLIDSAMKEPFQMELVGDFWVAGPIFKGCYGDSLLYSDAELHRLRRFTSPATRVRSPCHRPHHTSKPGSPRCPSSPHPGRQLLTCSRSLPRLNTLAARAVPTAARDAAPTPQLQSTQTLLQPRNPPAPKSQPRTASITSTPLGLAGQRHWQTTLAESRQSMASLYTSPNFNFPRYPAVGPGNLTPSIPRIAGSHHVLSTWPPGVFTPGPSTL